MQITTFKMEPSAKIISASTATIRTVFNKLSEETAKITRQKNEQQQK